MKADRLPRVPVLPAVVLALVLVLVQGCSGESLKRTGFETLQNMRRLECQKDPSRECPDRERYEDYQQKRKKLLDSSPKQSRAATFSS